MVSETSSDPSREEDAVPWRPLRGCHKQEVNIQLKASRVALTSYETAVRVGTDGTGSCSVRTRRGVSWYSDTGTLQNFPLVRVFERGNWARTASYTVSMVLMSRLGTRRLRPGSFVQSVAGLVRFGWLPVGEGGGHLSWFCHLSDVLSDVEWTRTWTGPFCSGHCLPVDWLHFTCVCVCVIYLSGFTCVRVCTVCVCLCVYCMYLCVQVNLNKMRKSRVQFKQWNCLSICRFIHT